MTHKKIISFILGTIVHFNVICMATTLEPMGELTTEIQRAGCPTPVVEIPPETQPLLSRYSTSVQAFINANQEIVTESSWINKIPSLLGSASKDQMHYNLYRVHNSLMSVFESLNFKSPKTHLEDIKKSFEATTQGLETMQSRLDQSSNDLNTSRATLALKDQKIDSLDHTLKAIVQAINPVLFDSTNPLTEAQKNQEAVQSLERIVAYIQQNHLGPVSSVSS